MRLLSLAPSNTEILFALGLGEAIIGVTHLCDWPSEAKTKPKVGAWTETEPEKIVALKPDLIFTSTFLPKPLENWNGPGKVVHVAPTTLAGVYESIRTIGRATNTTDRANDIVTTMQRDFDAIRTNAPRERQRVYMEEWPQPPMASGNWVPELVEIAGGTPLVSKTGVPSSVFDVSKLITADPDCMIFHWCGFGKRFDAKRVTERPGWSEIRAIREGYLFAIDDSFLNRLGPRLVEGAREVQRILKRVFIVI